MLSDLVCGFVFSIMINRRERRWVERVVDVRAADAIAAAESTMARPVSNHTSPHQNTKSNMPASGANVAVSSSAIAGLTTTTAAVTATEVTTMSFK